MSAPNFRACAPSCLLMLSVQTYLLPVCGSWPSKLLPMENDPGTTIKGTPSKFLPSPGVIPALGLLGSLKHWLEADLVLAHVSEARFIDHAIAEGPYVGDVQLLHGGRHQRAEAGNVGACGLEE